MPTVTHLGLARRGKVLILILAAVLLPTPILIHRASPHLRITRPAFSCPSPHAPDVPPMHGEQCVGVPSAVPAFSVELCSAPRTCNAFTLRVRRADQADCSRARAAQDPSEDRALNRWIKQHNGPDGFMLRTDGAERLGSEAAVHEGGCSYRFDVRLRNAGPVFVEAWWTYENYVAYSETNSSWPDLLLRPLFARPIQLAPCPSHCTPVPPKPLLPSRTFFTPATNTSAPALPACAGREPIRGSYLPAHPLDVLYPPFDLPAPTGKPVVGRYQFVPHSCEWKHAGRRFQDVGKCTEAKKHVLVIGDSHGRVVYDVMLHRLQGHQDILTVSDKQGSKSGVANNLDLNFLWDPRGYEYFPDKICAVLQDKPVDALIISMGAHHAGDDTTAHFIAQLTSVLQSITACSAAPAAPASADLRPTPPAPAHLVYLTQTAQPPRQDEWVRQYNDRRTNARQLHWGALARGVALDHGWSVVDQFALTAPHVWDSLNVDMAHYLGTDAIDPIVDEVIDKAGLCPGDGS